MNKCKEREVSKRSTDRLRLSSNLRPEVPSVLFMESCVLVYKNYKIVAIPRSGLYAMISSLGESSSALTFESECLEYRVVSSRESDMQSQTRPLFSAFRRQVARENGTVLFELFSSILIGCLQFCEVLSDGHKHWVHERHTYTSSLNTLLLLNVMIDSLRFFVISYVSDFVFYHFPPLKILHLSFTITGIKNLRLANHGAITRSLKILVRRRYIHQPNLV